MAYENIKGRSASAFCSDKSKTISSSRLVTRSGLSDWLIVLCLVLFSTVFQLHHSGQCTYQCFPGVILTITVLNILSKLLAAFPDNHCQFNRQRWKRNESCNNDYHQSSERILAELGIELATFCSQVRNTTEWAMGVGRIKWDVVFVSTAIWMLSSYPYALWCTEIAWK